MVSAAGSLRGQIRKTIKGFLHHSVRLSELEYQPE
ncbi:ferric-chelate reductase [Penicillium manginii]|nr:ferric-chelate reductase [Penicillium manginii]KAJ5732841.1 ferric-chelate reductase [Penicillium manginii]